MRFEVPSIFNNDQGSQFTSKDFISIFKREHIHISKDSKGQALDIIFIERTWRTMKYEHIFLYDYLIMTKLRNGLSWFIEYFNTRRPHESLGTIHLIKFIIILLQEYLQNREKLIKYS